MSNSISWKTLEIDGNTRILLHGSISEETDFSALVDQAADTLVLDLAEVDQINSCGVREWINFVNDIEKRGIALELHRCSPAIVRQLNMISNFRGNGVIRSVLAPYYCDACEHETSRVLVISDSDPHPIIDETMECPNCGEEMEFDDLPDTYLDFLES